MSTTQKHECPTEIQALWNAAEKIGFSDFLWMPKHNVLMASLPNAHLEDDRVPITWDMYEMHQSRLSEISKNLNDAILKFSFSVAQVAQAMANAATQASIRIRNRHG